MILEGIALGLNRLSQVVQCGHNMAVHAQNHHSVLAWLIKVEVEARVTACIEVLYVKLFER